MTRLVLSVLAVAGLLGAVPAPATAAPSCVAQSVQSEHAALGPAWGHDLIAALASDGDLLRSVGFDSFGELASFAARQDPGNCPPDL